MVVFFRNGSTRTLSLPCRLGHRAPRWFLVLGLSLLCQCNQQEPAPAAQASAAAKAEAPAAAEAEAETEPTTPPALAESAPPPPASAGDAGACGEKGQPDCPLQAFMKREVKASLKAKEFEKLAAALEKVSKTPPRGYDEWTKIALSGVAAAKKKDEAGAKESCESCHDKYEDKFKEEHRAEPLP